MRHPPGSFHDPRRPIVRAFAPGNLVIGAVAVVGAVVMVYAFWWRMGRIPVLAIPLSAIMIVGGLRLLARPFADACGSCGRKLTLRGVRFPADSLSAATAALRSGDAAEAVRILGPAGTGEAFAQLWYCPGCGGAAVWKSDGAPVALGGDPAKALAETLAAPAPDEEDAPEPDTGGGEGAASPRSRP